MGKFFKHTNLTTQSYTSLSVSQNLLVSFTLLALIAYSHGFIYSLLTDLGEGLERSQDLKKADGPVTAQHPEIMLIYVTLYLSTALLLLKHWRDVIPLLIRQKYVVGLLALVLLSSIWSVVPGLTFSRGVALTGSTLFGVLLALEFTPRQQLHLLTITGIFLILSSLVWALAIPDLGIAKGLHAGLWQGIFAHKNILGKVMVLVSFPLFLSSVTRRRRASLYQFFFWLSVALLVLSSSRTAQFSAIGLYLALSIYLMMKHGFRTGLVAGIATVLLVGNLAIQYKYEFVAPLALEKLTLSLKPVTPGAGERQKALNCDLASMTMAEKARIHSACSDRIMDGNGRFEMWTLVVQSIKQAPILGYGYGGFWLGGDGPSAQIWEKVGNWSRHAHNGLLDILLELGLIGLTLFILTLVHIISRTLPPLLKPESTPLDLFYPSLVLLIFLCNMGESDFIAPNFLFWILIVMSAMSVTRRQNVEQESAIKG